jgi:hypothetical protein
MFVSSGSLIRNARRTSAGFIHRIDEIHQELINAGLALKGRFITPRLSTGRKNLRVGASVTFHRNPA